MANIITLLEKEIEKKNTYVDEKGNTINPEKIEAMAKKSYIADLKAGVIDFGVTFESYHAGVLADYMPLESVIKDTLFYDNREPLMPDADLSECSAGHYISVDNREPVAN